MKKFILPLSLIISLGAFAAIPKSDAEILNMLMTVNTEEMNLSNLGKRKAEAPRVRDFAEKMINAHTNNNERVQSLKQTEDMKLKTTMRSDKTISSTESTIEKLSAMKGKEFDKAFMDAQVKAHQDALSKIESAMIPQTKNEKLKALLETTKGNVEHHLKEAKEVRSKL